MVVEVLTYNSMNGLHLCLGVLSAGLGLILLVSGIIGLVYGVLTPETLIGSEDGREQPSHILLGMGLGYFAFGLLLVSWPPAVAWIIVAPVFLTGTFLLVVDHNLQEDEDLIAELDT
jgi:hypothetical protein